jgi:hypothetical protein
MPFRHLWPKQRFAENERKKKLARARVKHYHNKKQATDLQREEIQHGISSVEVIMDE